MFLRSLFPLACVLLLAFSSCAMPSRVGYDRDRGSYANMPRTGNAGEEGASVATGAVVTADSSWNAIFVSWLGTPYRYGGSTRQGTDCSGFVMSAFKEKTGITLPRSSKAGFKNGVPVERDQLQVGDILYFTNRWGMIDHAAIYIGNDRFIHSSTSKGVVVTSMSDPYWDHRYKGARRYTGSPSSS